MSQVLPDERRADLFEVYRRVTDTGQAHAIDEFPFDAERSHDVIFRFASGDRRRPRPGSVHSLSRRMARHRPSRVGSGGRIRTYDMAVNSRPLYH